MLEPTPVDEFGTFFVLITFQLVVLCRGHDRGPINKQVTVLFVILAIFPLLYMWVGGVLESCRFMPGSSLLFPQSSPRLASVTKGSINRPNQDVI